MTAPEDGPPRWDEEPPPDDDTLYGGPWDVVAERCALGGMLLSPAAADDVADTTAVADFFEPRHQVVFEAVLALRAAGSPVDAVTVAGHLQRAGALTRAGGPAYLHTLASSPPAAASAGWYARHVAGLAVVRRVFMAGRSIVDRTRTGEVDPAAAVEHAHHALAAATDSVGTAGRAARTIDELLDEALDDLERGGLEDPGLLWGWTDVDREVLPLRPGQLCVVGARPGVGKSVFLGNVARHVAVHQRRPVVVHTLEMSQREYTLRILAAEARVPLADLQKGRLVEVQWDRVAAAQARIAGAPLVIDDDSRVGLPEIRASIRRHCPALVVLDYLQLARLPDMGPRSDRRQQLEAFTRELKLTAKADQVPVLTAAQLNRGSESRSDKRPQMADLRETGGVENDADLVLLLHREDAYQRESPRAGELDVIIAKQRGGPTGTVPLAAQLGVQRLTDLAR